MAIYLITYDLDEASRDEYQELYDKLDEYDARKITKSSWAIRSDEDRTSIIGNDLRTVMQPTDKLFVTRILRWSASATIDPEVRAWLSGD